MSAFPANLTRKGSRAALVAPGGCQAITELDFVNNRRSLFFHLNPEVQGIFLS